MLAQVALTLLHTDDPHFGGGANLLYTTPYDSYS